MLRLAITNIYISAALMSAPARQLHLYSTHAGYSQWHELVGNGQESPHRNITELASSYGFSRASFYKIKEAYEKNGVQALVPSKSGPRQAHKLTAEYRFFIDDHPKASSEEIRLRLQKERGLTASRRTIERYRSRKKSC